MLCPSHIKTDELKGKGTDAIIRNKHFSLLEMKTKVDER